MIESDFLRKKSKQPTIELVLLITELLFLLISS